MKCEIENIFVTKRASLCYGLKSTKLIRELEIRIRN